MGMWNPANWTWQPETDYQVVNYAGATYNLGSAPMEQSAVVDNETDEMYVGSSPIPDYSSVKGANGNEAVFGMILNTSGTRNSTSYDEVFMYGATVWLFDQTPPAMTSAQPASSSQWTNDGGKTYSVNVSGSDNGVGMKYFNLTVGNGIGATSFQQATNPCVGDHTSGYCPSTWGASFNYQLPEGHDSIGVQPYDAAVNAGAAQVWTADIDRTPPQITLNPLPQYVSHTATVSGTATDPPAPGADASSGVASVTVSVQSASGTTFPVCSATPTSSGAFSCSWDTTTVPEGRVTVGATATDGAGNVSSSATSPTLVDNTPPAVNLSGLLYDHQESGAAIGAGVVDLGVDAIDLDAANDGADTAGVVRVEMLIDGADTDPSTNVQTQNCSGGSCDDFTDFSVDTSRLASGTHTVTVKASDQAGNVGTTTLTVTVDTSQSLSQTDPPAPSFAPAPSTTLLDPQQAVAVSDANVVAPNVVAASTSASTAGGTFSPSLEVSDAAPSMFSTAGSDGFAVADQTASHGISIDTDAGRLGVVPTAASDQGGQPAVINGAALVYPQTGTQSDTLVRPTDLGAATYTLIEGPVASQTYSWSVSLNGGQTLQQLSDGSVAVLEDPSVIPAGQADTPDETDGEPGPTLNDSTTFMSSSPYVSSGTLAANPAAAGNASNAADAGAQFTGAASALSLAGQQVPSGQIVAVIHAPWALDSLGRSIPTSLSVNGNVLTLTVAHNAASAAYPVIADLETSTCRDTSPCSSSGPPSTAAMQTYANKWHHSYNTEHYPAFQEDCTNYMSQILHAGGVKMFAYDIRGAYEESAGAWYMDSQHGLWSRSWTVAASLFHWALKNHYAENLHASQSWQPGDFVAWAFSGGRTIDHWDYVYSVSNGIPNFYQHSGFYDPARPMGPASDSNSFEWRAKNVSHETPLWWVHIRFVSKVPG